MFPVCNFEFYRLIQAVALLLGLCVIPIVASAEEETPARRLTNATGRLVPYDLEGQTLHALTDLAVLNDSLDVRVAQTSRFLTAAASVDLYILVRLSGDEEGRAALAQTLNTTVTELSGELERLCEAASDGTYDGVLQSYRTVASCVDTPNTPQCSMDLRQVADRGVGSAAAARLLLLRRVIEAAQQARRADPGDIAAPLIAASGPLCASPPSSQIRQICQNASSTDSDQTLLARAVYTQALSDISALEEAGEGNDPFVTVSSEWVEQSREDLGWLAFPIPLRATNFARSKLPAASSQPSSMPLEYMVVSSTTGASFALAPTLIVKSSSPTRLDQQADLALPGKVIMPPPFRFRPVVRPVKQVTAALRELRSDVGELLESLGDDSPSWLANHDRTLGIVMDNDMMMTDVARFIWSARDAGYERFAIIGRHDDGSLAAIPVTVGREDDNSANQLPRVTVGPTGVRLAIPQGPFLEFERTDSRVGANVARRLNGHNPAFSIQAGQPWMSFGWLFPTMDAIMHAGHPNVRRCVLLLP